MEEGRRRGKKGGGGGGGWRVVRVRVSSRLQDERRG